MTLRRDRRGTALVAVLAALTIAAIAATTAAAIGRTLQQDARGAGAALAARTAADGALATVLASWPTTWSTLVPGASDARTVTSPAGVATVRALRLDASRYFLTAEAASAAIAGPVGPAVRRIGLFARLDGVAFDPPATLVAAGPVTLAIDTDVVGPDAPPPNWTDCTGAALGTGAAIAAPSVSTTGTSRISGAVLTAPTAWSPPVPERFGDVDRDALAARADIDIPAGGSIVPIPRATVGANATCIRDRTSWGDPFRGSTAVAPCTGDFPVVHLRGAGTTLLRGPARFQGTLLVDGSLDVIGRIDVAGVIVVGGAIQARPGSLVVDGAVLVRGGAISLGSGSRIRRSRCATDRAAAAAARPAPLPRHAWVDVVR